MYIVFCVFILYTCVFPCYNLKYILRYIEIRYIQCTNYTTVLPEKQPIIWMTGTILLGDGLLTDRQIKYNNTFLAMLKI